MSIRSFAERELDLLGLFEHSPDPMNVDMRRHILHMIDEFSAEGHSGFSAAYAISILEKLLRFEPVTPLSGEDWEWVDVAEQNGSTLWQNSRCSRVFKDSTGAYDIEGKVFWEWYTDPETGEKYKSHYTSIDSRVPVTFPYTPKTEYVERVND